MSAIFVAELRIFAEALKINRAWGLRLTYIKNFKLASKMVAKLSFQSLLEFTVRNIHRPFAMKSVKICRFKTFWMRIFARRTFFPFRCFSIHGKMCVFWTYCILLKNEFKRWAHTARSALSLMSGSPTSNTDKTETQQIYNSAMTYGQAEKKLFF